MPGAPSSVLAPSSDARPLVASLLLVAIPGAPSSILAPGSNASFLGAPCFRGLSHRERPALLFRPIAKQSVTTCHCDVNEYEKGLPRTLH